MPASSHVSGEVSRRCKGHKTSEENKRIEASIKLTLRAEEESHLTLLIDDCDADPTVMALGIVPAPMIMTRDTQELLEELVSKFKGTIVSALEEAFDDARRNAE